jgi:hypothetical protein
MHIFSRVIRIRLRPICPLCLRVLNLWGLSAIATGRCIHCGAGLKWKHGRIWLHRIVLTFVLAGAEYFVLESLFPGDSLVMSRLTQTLAGTANALGLTFIVHALTARFELAHGHGEG